MPQLEAKEIYKELSQGQMWPVYWAYGPETLKIRELFKRIKAAIPDLSSLNYERLDASEISAAEIVDRAQSLSLLGGIRLLYIRDAHLLKDPDILDVLLEPKKKIEELSSVCFFVAKDLDGRRKFSKTLASKAALIPCPAIAEAERMGWIDFLSKRRNLNLPETLKIELQSLEDWSLELVDQELEKWELSGGSSDSLGPASHRYSSQEFLDALFGRNASRALSFVKHLAENPDESLPLLGLLSWNVKQLALYLSPSRSSQKTNPYLAERLRKWGTTWNLAQVIELQKRLADLDFELKQTATPPLGAWTWLVSSTVHTDQSV